MCSIWTYSCGVFLLSISAETLETLATQPAAATTDAGSFTARSADDVLKLRDAAATADAATGVNDSGGTRSGWGAKFTRPAQATYGGSR